MARQMLTEWILGVELVDKWKSSARGQTGAVASFQPFSPDASLLFGSHSQNADGENDDESNLLLGPDAKTKDHGQWHHEDDEIRYDTTDGVGKQRRRQVHTGAGLVPVPETADGTALEDERAIDGDRGDDAGGHDEIHETAKVLAGIDAVIEEQDAQLGGQDRWVPQDQKDV